MYSADVVCTYTYIYICMYMYIPAWFDGRALLESLPKECRRAEVVVAGTTAVCCTYSNIMGRGSSAAFRRLTPPLLVIMTNPNIYISYLEQVNVTAGVRREQPYHM